MVLSNITHECTSKGKEYTSHTRLVEMFLHIPFLERYQETQDITLMKKGCPLVLKKEYRTHFLKKKMHHEKEKYKNNNTSKKPPIFV
jgi:hypothetical protein